MKILFDVVILPMTTFPTTFVVKFQIRLNKTYNHTRETHTHERTMNTISTLPLLERKIRRRKKNKKKRKKFEKTT